MRSTDLVTRGLRHYWRTNVAVVLGVATAVAVLAGALLVGDSVRGSLRDLVLLRLGRVDRAVMASGFFRERLADDLRADPGFGSSFADVCPIVAITGVVSDQGSGKRVSRVQVYGVDGRFWRFHGGTRVFGPNGRDALISRALAGELSAGGGATIVVRVERPSAIPIESLHGRKDDLGRSLRLTVKTVIDPEETGDFSLQPGQGDVRAVFVPLALLQEQLGLTRKVDGVDRGSLVNVLLVADSAANATQEAARHAALEGLLRRHFRLDDVGLTVRSVGSSDAIESPAGLLDEPRAKVVEAAATELGMKARPVFTYLANTIRSGDRQVPYSLVTAIDLGSVAPATVGRSAESLALQRPAIVLNDWTARELAVKVGDSVSLDYFVWEDPGRLVTKSADFQVAAIIPISGAAADRDLAPVYPGITEAKTLGDWDPPFPIDLKRVRKVDEDYWDRYRTTPKAFIPFDTGQRLWRSRFGDRTSVRLEMPEAMNEQVEARRRYVNRLQSALDPIALGLAVRGVRADGLAASRGATDFGEYFTYFSFFLVVSALMLAALFFRLGVEQRVREVGLLRAVGFTTARIRHLFSLEGALLAAVGSAIGIAGAVAYGALMTAGLRTWWSGAVGTTAIRLHVNPVSLAAGAAGAFVAAIACIWWTLRGLSRLSERALLAGTVSAEGPAEAGRHVRRGNGRWGHGRQGNGRRGNGRAGVLAVAFSLVGVALVALGATGRIDRAAGFFGGGSTLLVASLCVAAFVLRRPPRSALHGTLPLWRVGRRNAADRPGRSVLAIGVIASATFILIAVDAFRREGPPATDRHSGVGGYPLLVDLLVPIVDDPNARDGREALGLDPADALAVEPFRVLPGDDASCLNLYEPARPRILGARRSFVDAGRFAFQRSLAADERERANPWLLLDRDLGPDVVPVIADANSMTYVLHKSLGDEVVVSRGGKPLRLRLVAALSDSIFQGELVMGDAAFVRLFPEQEGYRFLLIDAPADRAAQVASAIEDHAADLGADAVETSARLAEFHAVENTYLSTFQALGGLGLLVGTIGLAAVLLRNVLERRRELALLGAIGYRRGDIFTIIVSEQLLLLVCGLAAGALCALVAIAPALAERGGRLPATWTGALLLVAVFAAGLVSSVVATRAALRTPLLAALRSE